MAEQGLAFSKPIYMGNLSVSRLELKVAFFEPGENEGSGQRLMNSFAKEI